jgi:hypothetical protein
VGRRGVFRGIAAGGVLLLTATAAQLYHLRWKETEPLRAHSNIARLNDAEIAADWDLLQRLENRDGWLGLLAPSRIAARHLEAAYVSEGDRIIASYRTSQDSDTTHFAWPRAQTVLEHAQKIATPNPEIDGKLALVRGYVNLNLAIGQIADRSRMKESVKRAWKEFDQAATLLPNLPDPHLGLARLYVYSYIDPDMANEEWDKAEQRHYKRTPREIEQEADGFRVRGQKEISDRREHAAAKEDVARAKELYKSIADYDDVRLRLQLVAEDEQALNPPPPPPVPVTTHVVMARKPVAKPAKQTRRTQAWQSPKAGKRRKS